MNTPPIGGGGANACMCLAREYAKAGNDVAIVTAWFPGLPEREEIAFPADDGGKVVIHRLHAKRKHQHHCGSGEMKLMQYFLGCSVFCWKGTL